MGCTKPIEFVIQEAGQRDLIESSQEFLPSIRNKRLDGNIRTVYDFL